MKTRRFGRSVWSMAAVAALLAAGCGARTVGEARGPEAGGGAMASTNPPVTVAATSTNGEPAAAADSAPPPVRRSELAAAMLPPEVVEVVKLVESGAGDEVVRAYVTSSQVPFELTLDQIIYLRDIGVPDGVVAAMMRRGSELRDRATEAETMQTNLVQAVEQIREAIATNGPAPTAEGAGTAADAGPGAAAGPPPPSPVVASTPQAPADAPQEVGQFYSSLSPYGTWYQVPSYGWVWQPSVVVVNSGWAPYNHGGRWVWSDWGWYWASDYSWGWAPFHYGRWSTYPGLGWCWVPGSVWGPSWVTWRHCDTHIGWAPLPPACGWSSGIGLTWYGSSVSVGFGFGLAASCYTFVPSRNFCHRNLSHHAVRGHHAGAVYQNSTVVNNVINGNNNVIVNNGVGYNTVASLVREEVPKVRVKTLPADGNASQPLRADRVERSKEGMVVYRPAPVEATGGSPTPIRPEVRPAVSTASGVASIPSGGGRGTGNPPVRPNVSSRYGATPVATPSSTKPVESRGAPSANGGIAGSQTPAGARPAAMTSPRPSSVPMSRPSSVRPSSSSTPPPKATESRGVNGTPAVQGNPGTTPSSFVAPTRTTTPVPLGDPSRNLPSRAPSTAPRTTAPNAPTAKPANESRSYSAPVAPTAPAAPARTYQATPRAGGVPTPSMAAPNRMPASAPTPKMDYQRPAAPSAAPAMMAPARPSYSAPAPAMSAPRPTVSAPAPSYSAPRPAMSAPAPAMAAPTRSAPVSAPAPSSSPAASGARGGGGRSQPN